MNNTDMKKRHFPRDRVKLHELLDKREQDLIDLQDELKDLRAAVTEADHTAIHTTAEAYSVTPDMLKELFEVLQSGKRVPPELIARMTPLPVPEKTVKKEEEKDDYDDEAKV